MFSALRQGSLFYVLEKSDHPRLKVGTVVSVSTPVPRYNTYMNQNFDTVVDVVVKVGDEEVKFEKLPSSMSIANSNAGVVVSESKEAMSSEVEAMLRSSRQIIESVPYHEKVMTACDGMLRELNPQFAKEKEQEEKIGMLEQKMDGMDKTLSNISKMLNDALNTKKMKYENDKD